MRHAALIGALCVVCATACSEETGPNISGVDAIDITRVNVSPSLDTLFVADTLRPTDRLQMSATVIGHSDKPIPTAAVVWASSKQEVAKITEGGIVIPTGYGTTVISASASAVGKATIVVMPATRSVVITPGTDTIFVDDPMAPRDTIRLTAKALDEKGTLIPGVMFTWSSAATGTAVVSGAGTVLARTLGVTNVTAISTGGQSGTASVRVASVVKTVQVTSPVTRVLAKDTVQLTATALGYDNKPMGGRTFTWTSSNPAVATVDNNGRAIFLKAGSASFTARSAFTTSAVTVDALDRSFQQISSGDDYTCGFTNLGRGYCWGVGDGGQLASPGDSSCFDASDLPMRGGGSSTCTLAPKRFSGPAIEFTAVESGSTAACGISKDQQIYCWGKNDVGQIGNGGKGGGAQPSLATVAQERFDSITVGGSHACALTIARLAYCWGNDVSGQLGDNRLVISTTPIPVIGNRTFSAISAGDSHTCGISSGQVYCWGANGQGQLGIGTTDNLSQVPRLVSSSQSFVAISAGGNHTCALNTSGAAFCWGSDGSLESVGSGFPVLVPTAVGGGPFVRISAGRFHTCAMSADGVVSCWGNNLWGQLGNGSVSNSAGMATVSSSVPFKSITAGTHHTCALGNDGETYCWGSNVFGELGNELQAAYRASPQKVAPPR